MGFLIDEVKGYENYLSFKVVGCRWVCLFAISSETANSDELKFE